MKISFAAVIAAALTLSGCNTVPASLKPTAPVSEGEVFKAVACDLRDAVEDDVGLEDWGATVIVTFNRNTEIDLKPQGEWKVALASVKIDAKPSLETDHLTENNLPLMKTYNSLRSTVKAPATSIWQDCPDESPGGFSNGLGIGDALKYDWSVLKNAPKDVELVKVKPNIARYTRSFTVTHTAGGSLSFTLGPLDVKTEGSSAIAGSMNSLEVDFAYARPQPPAPPGPRRKTAPTTVPEILEDYKLQDRQQQILTNALENAAIPAE